jgi:hypothetical protein
MAVDVIEILNLYDVFVNYIFGSMGLAVVGVWILLLLIGVVLLRMSVQTFLAITILYIISFSMLIYGGLAAVLVGVFAILWFAYGIMRLIGAWAS